MCKAGFAVLTVCLCLTVTAPAQDSSCPDVPFPVSILGAEDALASNLTAGDFAVSIGRKPIPVKSVSRGSFPHSTAIVLDRSASMRHNPRWAMAQEFTELVARASHGNSVTLALFDGTVSEFIDARGALSEDGAGFRSAPQSGKQDGRTALYDAIMAAISSMSHRGPEDMVIAITDAVDNVSKANLDDVRKALLASRTRLVVIDIPPAPSFPASRAFPSQSDWEEERALDLRELALESGGAFLNPLGTDKRGTELRSQPGYEKDPELAYRNYVVSWLFTAYNTLNRGYRLSLQPGRKEQRVKIEVPKLPKGSFLFYPRALNPCGNRSTR